MDSRGYQDYKWQRMLNIPVDITMHTMEFTCACWKCRQRKGADFTLEQHKYAPIEPFGGDIDNMDFRKIHSKIERVHVKYALYVSPLENNRVMYEYKIAGET